jgi:2-oxoglutarate/2-oxoacid ferredoxin oxidoreductase subunit alpha
MTQDKLDNQPMEFNWKIAGKAGEGVMVVSKMLAKICKRHGLNAFNYLEYPSLIKGGHQTGQVYASSGEARCQKKNLDVLVTLGPAGFDEHAVEITPETVIVYNLDAGKLDKETETGSRVFELPFISLAKEATGSSFSSNIGILGATAYLLGLDRSLAEAVIRDEFKGKPEKIVDDNIKTFNLVFEKAGQFGQPIRQISKTADTKILVTGNEAVGLGALAAGVQFYSAYPMTPATALLHFLAAQQDNYPLVVKHAEDEIGAINHALGASFAGVRSMTGTSGGGFALMVEALSLASLAEIPLVILEAQRKGPATGLPTWTEQADLSFMLTAGHGDTQQVVFTPGTIEEHFELTKQAFYLAEKYQVPVIILSDKFILESHSTLDKPEDMGAVEYQSEVGDLSTDGSYRRYKITSDGISPRSIPGQVGGLQLTNSYEHDEFGFATEDAGQTTEQVEKRARKFEKLKLEMPKPYLIGPDKAEVTLVGWGSTISVLKQFVQNDSKVNAICLPAVWPFPVDEFIGLAEGAKKLVMVEGNQSGQCQKLIKQETGIEMADHVRRYDGRPFYTEDLEKWLKKKEK